MVEKQIPQKDSAPPLAAFTEAIAYFIAGSFVVNLMGPELFSQDPVGTANLIFNLLTYIVGWFSISISFVFLLTTIPCKCIQRFSLFFNRHKHWLVIILFPITVPQIASVILGSECVVLSITAGVFLAFIFVAVAITSLKALPKFTIEQLVTLSLAFVLSAIIRLFQEAGKLDLAVLLTMACVPLIFALLKLSRKKREEKTTPPPK